MGVLYIYAFGQFSGGGGGGGGAWPPLGMPMTYYPYSSRFNLHNTVIKEEMVDTPVAVISREPERVNVLILSITLFMY